MENDLTKIVSAISDTTPAEDLSTQASQIYTLITGGTEQFDIGGSLPKYMAQGMQWQTGWPLKHALTTSTSSSSFIKYEVTGSFGPSDWILLDARFEYIPIPFGGWDPDDASCPYLEMYIDGYRVLGISRYNVRISRNGTDIVSFNDNYYVSYLLDEANKRICQCFVYTDDYIHWRYITFGDLLTIGDIVYYRSNSDYCYCGIFVKGITSSSDFPGTLFKFSDHFTKIGNETVSGFKSRWTILNGSRYYYTIWHTTNDVSDVPTNTNNYAANGYASSYHSTNGQYVYFDLDFGLYYYNTNISWYRVIDVSKYGI